MLHITWIINTFAAHSVMLFLLLLDFSLSRSVTLRVILQVARAGEKTTKEHMHAL